MKFVMIMNSGSSVALKAFLIMLCVSGLVHQVLASGCPPEGKPAFKFGACAAQGAKKRKLHTYL
jgi:hypothetical protein